ncbi:MAG: bifunctional diaminohydroxyphosphoribosylaminopyrimidine deaminase/5-amino-6-(5-phosphoribosylamino)uracil reductase RibD [Nocardioides sp.]|uniref:bifunctional diaminohydroxyphosphoribosylaminopyrimidine deaminase/5-amino-6-(5-phosphoribosylamino)uracil reductase RibD n=1 Tax=Nocardioides sp. TaxID=35761 RepID=UPI0039E5BBF0
MTTTAAEQAALRRAVELARAVPGRLLPNPRVGCVLLAPGGDTVAEGVHRGPGTPHAEADALMRAGERARGATAVVTLEPCHHTGRTGPCTRALADAGITRVVYAVEDPNPVAAGGAAALRAAGIETVLVEAAEAAEALALNERWLAAVRRQRPYLTWKLATTLDGRSAAADGTSRWISSAEARADVHRLRAEADAILAGTGTVLADDPALTARAAGVVVQPLRVVLGERDLPPSAHVLDAEAETVHLRTRDLHVALKELWQREIRHVLLEGGPTLAAAFLRAGLVDEVIAYVAPTLLGAGSSAVGDLGIATIADAHRLTLTDVTVLGGTVRLTATPAPPAAPDKGEN